MADVPGEVRYGRVVGRFVLIVADSDDPGNVPEELPLSGTVTLTPSVRLMRFPTTEPPRLAVLRPVVCNLVDGWLTAEGNDMPGVNVVASSQPEGQPVNLQWIATFQLDGLTSTEQPSPVVVVVEPDTEVDLTTVIPASPDPGTVELVTHQEWADIQEIYQNIQDIIAGGGIIQGADGREVQLQATETAIEWRYSGENLWRTLVTLEQIRGAKGDKGDQGLEGPPNSLSIGTVESGASAAATIEGEAPNQVLNLVLPEGDPGQDGTDGREAQFRVSGGYIQWQYVGDPVWSNLVPLSAITGPAGADGTALPDLTVNDISQGSSTTKSAVSANVFKAAVQSLISAVANRVTALEEKFFNNAIIPTMYVGNTPVSIGNGALTLTYSKSGKVVTATFVFYIGSTTSFGGAVGYITLACPPGLPPASPGTTIPTSIGTFRGSGVSGIMHGQVSLNFGASSDRLYFIISDVSSGAAVFDYLLYSDQMGAIGHYLTGSFSYITSA